MPNRAENILISSLLAVTLKIDRQLLAGIVAGEMCRERFPRTNYFFLNQNSLGWEKAYCPNTTFCIDILLALLRCDVMSEYTNSQQFSIYVILTISYLRAQTIETSSLPTDSSRPLFEQIEIFSVYRLHI